MVPDPAHHRYRVLPWTILTLALAVAACQLAPTGPDSASPASVSGGNTNQAPSTSPSIVNKQLAELRAVVAHYRDLDDAKNAGYTVEVTPCLELPGVGAMGFHFGNPTFINNPVPNHLEPELLLYEPEKNGNMRFVGVEYIIPFAIVPSTTTPAPVVLGQEMHADSVNQIWALHAWVGRENPTGIFEDWNPKVSCEFEP